MNITIIGTGYVGLVTGTCFAEMGTFVTCVDVDKAKIRQLQQGKSPVYEPGLDELLERNINKGRLKFQTDLSCSLDEADVVFIAVGTPPSEDGSADLRHVIDVARNIGKHLRKYTLIVTKSTVPVGTSDKVKAAIRQELDIRGCGSLSFDVASNPEFLKEGNAIKDFMSPDRIIVGIESETAKSLIDKLYKPFLLNNYRIIYMDIASAEMTKYASNAMLATRISFMNDIANLCELLGANVNMVRKGMGSDARIGQKFLYSGIGYGGSCFPKDVQALAKTGRDLGYIMKVIESVEEVNRQQKEVLFHKLKKYHRNLSGKKIALWGLSFKPETDDMREAPSLVIIDLLKQAGADVSVYDPIAMQECKHRIGNTVHYADDMYAAVDNAEALLLITEWKEFRLPTWKVIKKRMHGNLILDGRNIYDPIEMKNLGFQYEGIGIANSL